MDEARLDTPLDYASVRTLNSDLGSASIIVIDDSVSMQWVVRKTIEFFTHESCGKCTPCRDGTFWMRTILERAAGNPNTADIELLGGVARQMQGKCLCALGEFATMAVVTGLERFPADFVSSVGRASDTTSAIGSIQAGRGSQP
jgi:NADH-quinone oxidoreductase subunit F